MGWEDGNGEERGGLAFDYVLCIAEGRLGYVCGGWGREGGPTGVGVRRGYGNGDWKFVAASTMIPSHHTKHSPEPATVGEAVSG